MKKLLLLQVAGMFLLYNHSRSQVNIIPGNNIAYTVGADPESETGLAENEINDSLFSRNNTLYNKTTGLWTRRYFENRLMDSGRMIKKLPDGEWKGWYPDGQLRFIRHYSYLKLVSLKEEIRRGPKASFYTITSLVKQKNYRPAFFYNIPASFAALSEQEQFPYFPPFHEGLQHGLYMNYYPEGNIKDSGYYKNGLRDGLWIEWLDEGAIKSTGAYHHGYRKGDWKFYNRNGKLLYLKTFNRYGKQISRHNFQ